ncbi:MAG TPA: hypothetical protein VN691_05460 [Steroidobacteraceae bacterium]|nr:hypothetical protein [Steroidobacteraceae bacterium]
MNSAGKYFAGLLTLALLFGSRAYAEPYLAVRYGLKCQSCHVNPTGGGLRKDFGDVFAQTELPAHPIRGDWGLWTGEVTKFLRVGGDIRYNFTATATPGSNTVEQLGLQQARVYLEGQVIPDRLILYIDEQVAPGNALNREAYGIYWSASHEWYVKAGQMYLPFGFRLEDQTAFVYEVNSFNMLEPDDAVEFGWLKGHWDAQLDVSNGTFATPSPHGKEYGLQLSYVESAWRFGIAANDDGAVQFKRRVYGLFGGTRTGPVTWLAEVDMVQNEYSPLTGVTQAAALLEGDWLIAPGNNLKVTFEPFDPDRDVHGTGRSRWSLVYELTPVQFLQIRAGLRDYNGPRDIAAENQRLWFIQLHGFF